MKNYSRKEVSQLLRVSLCAVYKWEKKGILKSFKENGILKYDAEEVESFVKKRNASLEDFESDRLLKSMDVFREQFLKLKKDLEQWFEEVENKIDKKLQ